MSERLDAATFQAALPEGWTVEIYSSNREHVVRATHPLYGDATIGPKLRLVPLDVELLRDRVRDVEAPLLTYSQWLASGKRQGFVPLTAVEAAVKEMKRYHDAEDWRNAQSLGRALRLLAICIERGDVEPSDVAQALFGPVSVNGAVQQAFVYTLDCPVAEASSYGRDVAELLALLGQAAKAYGYGVRDVNDAPFRECDQVPSEVVS